MTDETMKLLTDTMRELMDANKDRYRMQNGLLQILSRACNLAVPLDRNELIEIINESISNEKQVKISTV